MDQRLSYISMPMVGRATVGNGLYQNQDQITERNEDNSDDEKDIERFSDFKPFLERHTFDYSMRDELIQGQGTQEQ